jgi:hypothetical protein
VVDEAEPMPAKDTSRRWDARKVVLLGERRAEAGCGQEDVLDDGGGHSKVCKVTGEQLAKAWEPVVIRIGGFGRGGRRPGWVKEWFPKE